MKFITVEVFIHLFIFDCSAKLVCIKDKPCVRTTITAKRQKRAILFGSRKVSIKK